MLPAGRLRHAADRRHQSGEQHLLESVVEKRIESLVLNSFEPPVRAAVVGASNGIGAALVKALVDSGRCETVFALSRDPSAIDAGPTVQAVRCDFDAPETIGAAAEEIGQTGPLDLVIVASGLLHDGDRVAPEKAWRHLNHDQMLRVFEINTVGPSLVAGAFLPIMRRDPRSVFAALAARVGSITDNRLGGWYSYRASKAALVMIIKSLAIELQRKRRNTICVALHPGTVDTGLSKPFQSATKPGQVVSPAVAANHLLKVIDGLQADDSGRQFAWDGVEIAP